MADLHTSNIGKRLLPVLIDQYALEEPQRSWASIPKDDDDISKGFQEVTYRQFAKAINKASWWLEAQLGPSHESFETIAYVGPKDLVYPVLTMAAVKVGRKLLLPSPFMALAAQVHVFEVTHCKTYLHAASSVSVVEAVQSQGLHLKTLAVPGPEAWFNDEAGEVYRYEKTWEEAKDDPVTIFHTSGTTGLPKPLTYTHRVWAGWDAWRLLPRNGQALAIDPLEPGTRIYSPLPTLHVIGMMLVLIWTVHSDAVAVLGPPGKPAVAEVADQVLRYSSANSAFLPPSLWEEIARDPIKLKTLSNLDTVYYGGSPLERSAGEKISKHVFIQPFIGTTEHPTWHHQKNDPDDWAYFSFHALSGANFEHRTGDLYELFFDRVPEREDEGIVFQIYPDLDRYATHDLWSKHPTKQGLWYYRGRADDMVVLSHGENLYATDLEAIIQSHPIVRSAVIGGQGHPQPFLILELTPEADAASRSHTDNLNEIWPVVEKANQTSSQYVALTKPLITFASPDRPFVRLVKGSVDRRNTIKLYEQEIDALYA